MKRLKFVLILLIFVFVSIGVSQVQWGPDVRLTNHTYGGAITTGHGWCLAVDSTSKVHMTWGDSRDTSFAIYYKMGSDTTWSADTMISFFDPALSSLDPNLDIDSLGVLHVIWWFMNTDVADLWYRQKNSFGWSSFIPVGRGIYPTGRADRAGNFHVVYVRPDSTLTNPRVCYQMRDRLSGWLPRETLTGDTIAIWSTCIAPDRSGRIHVVFLSNGSIFYRVKESGLWSPTFQLTNGGTAVHPQIVSDSLSNVHLIWSDTRDGGRAELYYKKKDVSGWLPDLRLTFTQGSSDSASLAVDDTQNVHVVWVDSTDGLARRQLVYMAKRDTQWTSPQQLTNAMRGRIRSPSLAVDREDRLHVVWSDSRDGAQWWNHDLFYKATLGLSSVEGESWKKVSGVGALEVFPNKPNPFSKITMLSFHANQREEVRIKVFDIAGRLIRLIGPLFVGPGGHEAFWDGKDSTGKEVRNGVYICRWEYQSNSVVQHATRKITLIR